MTTFRSTPLPCLAPVPTRFTLYCRHAKTSVTTGRTREHLLRLSGLGSARRDRRREIQPQRQHKWSASVEYRSVRRRPSSLIRTSRPLIPRHAGDGNVTRRFTYTPLHLGRPSDESVQDGPRTPLTIGPSAVSQELHRFPGSHHMAGLRYELVHQ